MAMQVEIQCPQCGGNTSFPETSHVFRCRFCSSSLHITAMQETLTYCISPSKRPPEEVPLKIKQAMGRQGITCTDISRPLLVYVPFWRMRAMVFNWICNPAPEQSLQGSGYEKRMRTASLDLTFPANITFDTGIRSLGVRTRALTVRLFEPSLAKNTSFLPPEIGVRAALRRVRDEVDQKIFRPKPGAVLFDTRIVGQVLSLVYFPIYTAVATVGGNSTGIVFDALAERITVAADGDGETGLPEAFSKPGDYVPARSAAFLPFRCPECGWDLPFVPYNRIHICRQCQRGWMENSGEYREIAYDIVKPPENTDEPIRFLPFWKIRATIEFGGETITRAKELIERVARILYRNREPAKGSLHFFIPAFRVRSPEAAGKAASRITRLQPELTMSDRLDYPKIPFMGAFVDTKGAADMIRVVLASLLPGTRRTFRDFSASRIHPESARLTYFPFTEDSHTLREPISGAIVEKSPELTGAESEHLGEQ